MLPLSELPRRDREPAVCVEPLHHEVRFRRRLAPSASGRSWWLDVAILVPLVDPEQVLRECEGFLVDSTDGRPIGVVDYVETDEGTGDVSGLEVAGGWFGRQRLHVSVDDIDLVVPATERIIVRVSSEAPPEPRPAQ